MHITRIAQLAGLLGWTCVAHAADRTELKVADFLSHQQPSKIIQNSELLPSADAREAQAPFTGTITLSETEMVTEPSKFKSNSVLDKDPTIFPAAAISFVTHNGDLVPTTQDVLRYGSTSHGKSYWDIIVQAGKVWSEPNDAGWSRASFPFSLMRSIEGETHNGVAMFLYKDGQISDLRFQVATQTAPFLVEDYFTAAGKAPAVFSENKSANEDEVKATYAQSVADAEKLLPWADLQAKVGKENLDIFDTDIKADEIVADGIEVDGKFYLKSCPTVAGELPYCDRQRFGVWSVTKSTTNSVAMLRLAEKYGPDVFDEKIVDYITEAKDVDGWEKTTFGDMLNMASGTGYGSTREKPYSIAYTFPETYYQWYEAPTIDAKIAAHLNGAKPFSWGPGKIMRYRDEDMFLLGEAMTRYIKKKGESYDTIWDMVAAEVYRPIGIHYAPINRTIEATPKEDQPLMAYGYYPTISDLAKIAKLFQNDGKFGDMQILNSAMLADIKAAEKPVGLNTGIHQIPFYRKAFWRGHMDSSNGCRFYYPTMQGWGGNVVSLFPNGVFAIRLAKNWDGDAGARRMDSLEIAADHVTDLCQ